MQNPVFLIANVTLSHRPDHKIQAKGLDEGRPERTKGVRLQLENRSYPELPGVTRSPKTEIGPLPLEEHGLRGSSCDGRSGITGAGTGLFRGLVVTLRAHGDSDRGLDGLMGMGDRGITGHEQQRFGGWSGV